MPSASLVAAIYSLAGEGQFAEAINAAMTAIEAYPYDIDVNIAGQYLAVRAAPTLRYTILQQICARHRVGDLDRLLDKLTASFAEHPERYELFAALSINLSKLELPDLAIQAFSQVLRPAGPQDVCAGTIVTEYDHSAGEYDETSAHHASINAFTTLLSECLEGPRRHLAVVDAACGSGLAGPTLRPWSDRLTGMDLSPAMLALAAQSGLYDALVEGDMVTAMQSAPHSADLVVCAGGTYYLRDLAPFLAAAHTCLKPGGQLFFADFPALDGMGVMETIGGTFRYCRPAALTRSLAAAHGFDELNCVLELSFTLPAFHWHFRKG